MKKIGEKKILGIWLFIAMLQIFILLNGFYAENIILGELSYYEFNTISQKSDIGLGKLISGLSELLIGLASIRQISTVSAQETSFNCCIETNSGARCQDVNSQLASSDPEGCENPLPTRCSLTSECVIGTCVFNSGESCAANSPKNLCESNGGKWFQEKISSVPQCLTGACVTGSEIQLTTEKQCEIISQSKGLDTDFRPGLSELDFPQILGGLKKGACVISQGNCRFVTISECGSMSGKFYENLLCTNPALETSCIPTTQTTCFQDQVHFVDSCGNLANVYDSSKANPNSSSEYWQEIQASGCVVDPKNPDSFKNCGGCNRFESTQCGAVSQGDIQPVYGDFVCKDLSCKDENGNERKNGEKWCLYDSKFGDGKDAVGSEQYIASCSNGQVQVDVCGTARGQICTQRVIKEGGKEFSTASCQVNEAIRCLDYNSGGAPDVGKCNSNAQCQITNVNVDTFFKFSMCTPEYPKGFDQKDQSNLNNKICSIANRECTVIYQKKLFGGWKCIANCNCEKKVFAEQLNNLCTSLGDCGSYINYIGDGTDNIRVSGAPSVSWTEYQGYADAENGKYIETHAQNDFVSALGEETNASKFTPEGADAVIAELGAKGLGAGIFAIDGELFGGSGFKLLEQAGRQVSAGDLSLTKVLDLSIIDPKLGSITLQTPLGQALSAFGIAAVGNVIGTLAGKFLANALGISGDAATVLTMATGIAGSVAAIQIAQQQGLITNVLNPATIYATYVVVAIIIAIIILGGFGKTKKVKVNFTCLPWEAPNGGSKCDQCNNDPFRPCTKYKCESLGQACRLINENTNTPICQSLTPESTPPVISPDNIVTESYMFQNQQQKSVDVKTNNGECIPEFVPVTFSLKTDEYSQCKWSFKRISDYESMENYPVEGSVYTLGHTFTVGGLSLGILNANNITGDLIRGFVGDISIYVKCKDSFGNFNLDDYVVNFCVNSGDDVTPVLHSLTTTSPANDARLKFGTSEVNFTMWTNEPAECKYSLIQGRTYNSMENSLNCSTNLDDREQFGWPCSGTLDLNQGKTFYIKCLDQPWLKNTTDENKRNANAQDFTYSLQASNGDLKISEISIFHNTKISLDFQTSTEIRGGEAIFPLMVDVLTSEGSSNGKASCSYQWAGNYIPFLNTNSNSHSQELSLLPGVYNIGIKCVDEAGNEANQDAKFSLNSDNNAPIAVRTYHSSGDLVVVTNEPAKCYVSFDSSKECNFNIGDSSTGVESMEVGFSTIHSTSWLSGKTYYIKCKDFWNNQNSKCAVKVTTS